nr:MAG TPA: hypothetical protein [Caudoviricetes sp.]
MLLNYHLHLKLLRSFCNSPFLFSSFFFYF